MDLDDSKYILQLARADVLSLPPTPGDWNVHVKRRDPDSAPAGDDHDMGEHRVDDTTSSPGAAHVKMEDTDSQGHHTPAADGSPRAAKAPRVHPRDSPLAAQHSLSSPDRLWGQAAAASPRSSSSSSQRGQKYYRMALVSAIQPSFGTDASSLDQGDGTRRGRVDSGVAGCEGEYGNGSRPT